MQGNGPVESGRALLGEQVYSDQDNHELDSYALDVELDEIQNKEGKSIVNDHCKFPSSSALRVMFL